jgi:uncharacterized protein YciI
MALYAVEVTLADDAELRARLQPQHRAHMTELAADGRVWLAGPWADGGSGGLMVFDVPDRATLDLLLAADPYARAGMVIARRIKAWQPTLGSRLVAPVAR